MLLPRPESTFFPYTTLFRSRDRVGGDRRPARHVGRQSVTYVLLHGFGQRFDLSVPLYLYLFAAGGVVFLSFVLVVLFAGDTTASTAIAYPRREVRWLLPLARSPWPRIAGGLLG